MNWKNANKELPDPGRLVLVCVKGEFHIARYSAALKGFRLREGSLYLPGYQDIQWIDIDDLVIRPATVKKSAEGAGKRDGGL